MGSQREYAYFKIQHFDFPLNDSLTKVFAADYIPIRIRVATYLSTEDNLLIDSTEQIISTDLVLFNLKRMHTSIDIAN
jgi:hypothetical protein